MAARNLKNATIALLVPLPSIAFFLFFIRAHSDAAGGNAVFSWCYNHPFLLANVLFFFNVNILFWIIGLIQSNNWMIDLYWTVIPVMLVHYYASHPMTVKDGLRSAVVIVLTWVWSVRLTHNYFRREKWQWGQREDWRFNEMRRQYGKQWWWVSFFAVYFSQQIFLIGICLPMYAIHMSDKPWDRWDFLATVACIIGDSYSLLCRHTTP
ncbi:hypothetical protein IHE45_19G086800 [Dioscorea alata]|uniref:Uncharacterized protein n=1 Tax=Dioscorea alata TaxID=55571 RepID=A0ACB7TZP2_DIOAL|nr:hypothetical protein IHE45_19G086800 [Dioscorea alata]